MAGCLRGFAKWSSNCFRVLNSPLLVSLGPVSGRKFVAAALTPVSSKILFGDGQPCALLRTIKCWGDLPQPTLKPIGPEDYQRWRFFLNQPKPKQSELEITSTDLQISKEIFGRVNRQIEAATTGRLFAIVHVAGRQFKITSNDIIVIRGNFVPTNGEVIRLEKVLAIGNTDFTVIGRPLLGKDFARIEATVIEKTYSHIITHFRYKRRKQFRRINFYRMPFTMLRINYIKLMERVNGTKDFEGFQDRVVT